MRVGSTPTRVKNSHVRPIKYASVSLAMTPPLTAAPSAIGLGFFSSPICSARLCGVCVMMMMMMRMMMMMMTMMMMRMMMMMMMMMMMTMMID